MFIKTSSCWVLGRLWFCYCIREAINGVRFNMESVWLSRSYDIPTVTINHLYNTNWSDYWCVIWACLVRLALVLLNLTPTIVSSIQQHNEKPPATQQVYLPTTRVKVSHLKQLGTCKNITIILNKPLSSYSIPPISSLTSGLIVAACSRRENGRTCR
jgi:hypothetical protein